MRRLLPLLLLVVLIGACGKATSHIPQSEARPEGAKPAAPPLSLPRSVGPVKHISVSGLHLIEGFEGFESCPYWDPYGRVWTRGYGETEGITQHSACISRAFGESNLRFRIERFYEWSLRGLGVALNQNQWDALDSFVWNLGAGIFQGTTLGNELRAKQFYDASRSMLQYDHAGGQVLEGLRIRREAEVRLFLTPVAEPSSRHQKQVELWHDYRLRSALRLDLTHGNCRTHPLHRYRLLCPRWKQAGDLVNVDIRRLHREGV